MSEREGFQRDETHVHTTEQLLRARIAALEAALREVLSMHHPVGGIYLSEQEDRDIVTRARQALGDSR